VENDTYLEIYSDLAMTNLLYYNDDYNNGRFSLIEANLTAWNTYYIKLRHYNPALAAHTDLKITTEWPVYDIVTNITYNLNVNEGKYAQLRFTAPETAYYAFSLSPYNNYDEVRHTSVELFSDAIMTKRIASGRYESDNPYPSMGMDMTAGTEYYIKFSGYLGVAARAELRVQKLVISYIKDAEMNGGAGPEIGFDNEISFKIKKPGLGSKTFYAQPYMAWGSDYYGKQGAYFTLDRDNEITVKLRDIDLMSAGTTLNVLIIIYTDDTLSEEVYRTDALSFVRSSHRVAPSLLEHTLINTAASFWTGAEVPAKYIYVNNPEWISDADIIQDETQLHVNRLIYQQAEITGYNSMYITHSTNNAFLTPTENFYYDVVFSNPTSSPVSVIIENPFYRFNSGWDSGYYELKNLYLERLNGLVSTRSGVMLEIPAYGNKLLFRDIFNYNDNISQILGAFIGIFFHFDVQQGQSITVGTLAAYTSKSDYMNLSYDNGILKAGIGNNKVNINSADFVYDRDGEIEVNTKIMGMDSENLNEVTANLSYIVDDFIYDGNLPVSIKDEFFGNERLVNRDNWVANLSPIYDPSIVINSPPSQLNGFTYTDSGGDWQFDYKHILPNSAADSRYMYKGAAQNYAIKEDVLEKYRYMGVNDITPAFPSGVTKQEIASKAVALGNWGTKYTYNIFIENIGNTTRTLTFDLYLDNFAGVTYTGYNYNINSWLESGGITIDSRFGTVDPNAGADDKRRHCEVATITIPAGNACWLGVSYLNGVGPAGFTNTLYLGTPN
jgi:hypothetical protein